MAEHGGCAWQVSVVGDVPRPFGASSRSRKARAPVEPSRVPPSVAGMDDALRLLARAREQVARAESLLAAADHAAWTGPSAAAYRARLDERRAACALLLHEIDAAYSATALAVIAAHAGAAA